MQWLTKKLSNSFRYCKKKNSKIQILKLSKNQKILKNQMILHCLEIIGKKKRLNNREIKEKDELHSKE